MDKTTMLAATVVAFGAAPALAQEITGAEGAFNFTSFTDSDVDTTATTLRASVEGTIAPNFGLGADLQLFTLEDSEDSDFTGTLHAMYMPSPESAFGVFFGQETRGEFEAGNFGIEGGFASANGNIEAYYGVVDSDDIGGEDVSIAGVGLSFDVGNNFTLGLDYESFTVADGIFLDGGLRDLTLSDTSLFASYNFVEGVSVTAAFGQIGASARSGDTLFVSDDDSEYFSLGVDYKFGRGTIFDARGTQAFGG